MQKLYIDTPEGLQDLCLHIKGKPWLALDTEFLRETTYYPKLCLLQLASDELAACVDPLAIDDLSPLLEILFDESIVKVFHSAHQDLEIFLHLWQRLPAPLFDTQPAAALVGIGDQVGYGVLVDKLLGIKLEKGHARTDWTRRPLHSAQIDYAYNDVIYLGQAYVELTDRLEQLGRSDWLNDDFKRQLDPDTYVITPEEAWKKVKGRQTLRGIQYAILQQLAAWREITAIQDNRPRRRIIKDEIMIDMARRSPKDLAQLGQIRGMHERELKRHGNQWLELIKQGRALPKEQWPRETIPPKLNAQQDVIADLLSAALKLMATEQNMTPASIALRKDIEQLVARDKTSPLLQGWRYAIAGKRLQQLLDGKATVSLTDGKPALTLAS